jgi:hypothetical protein
MKQKGFKISISDGYTEYTYHLEDINTEYSIRDIFDIIRKALKHKNVEGYHRDDKPLEEI